jgi:hypothetical protein
MIPARGRAPSALLPLAYLLTAAVAFVVAALAVLWLPVELAGHYYHPRILALTHTVTLGWITMTIMGASYQLIPIVLERPLWSERLAWWQYGLFVAGVAGLVGHFTVLEWAGLVGGAGLIVLATGAHLVNAALTVRGLRRWTFTARLVVMALLGFGLTAIFGAALGVNHMRQTLPGAFFANLHAHVHLALLGWVLPMVIGVAARVYPMFLLAAEPKGVGGAVQLWGLGLGVPATVLGLLFESSLAGAGGIAVAAAVTAHLVWIIRMLRTRKRPRLDWSLRFVLAGAAFLVPATALGLALAFDLASGPRWAMAYAMLAFGAWASLTIVGMMLKIVPFLVWYLAYSPLVGHRTVPTLAQMSWPGGEQLSFALLAAGMGALTVAVGVGEPTWIRAAGTVVALGALAFAATLARIVFPLWQCRFRSPSPEPIQAACHP